MIFTSALRSADAVASKSALSSGVGDEVLAETGRGAATGTGVGAEAGAGFGAAGAACFEDDSTGADEAVAAVAVNSTLGRVIAGSAKSGTTESVEDAAGAFETGAGETDAWSAMMIRRTRKAKKAAVPRYNLRRSIGIRYIKNGILTSTI